MKDLPKIVLFVLIAFLFLGAGCAGPPAGPVKKAPEATRPAKDYKFELRKTTKADVIARLGKPYKTEIDKDGYETLTYREPLPGRKYNIHTYTFAKKGWLSGHGRYLSSE